MRNSIRRPAKRRSQQRVKAWAWLSFQDVDSKHSELNEFGNGHQFQFPIFSSKLEAVSWKRQGCGTPGLLDRMVEITILVKR